MRDFRGHPFARRNLNLFWRPLNFVLVVLSFFHMQVGKLSIPLPLLGLFTFFLAQRFSLSAEPDITGFDFGILQ